MINNKKRLDDWEIDTIVGKGRRHNIVTVAERKSRKFAFKQVPTKATDIVVNTAIKRLKPYQQFIFILLVQLILLNTSLAERKSSYRADISIKGITPKNFVWHTSPSGVKFVNLENNQGYKGEYTTRRLLPAHFNSLPHYHPYDSRVTILSGTLHIGVTKKFDKKLTDAYPAGSFLIIPARAVHIVWTDQPVVLQLTEFGPRKRYFLNKNSKKWFISKPENLNNP